MRSSHTKRLLWHLFSVLAMIGVTVGPMIAQDRVLNVDDFALAAIAQGDLAADELGAAHFFELVGCVAAHLFRIIG